MSIPSIGPNLSSLPAAPTSVAQQATQSAQNAQAAVNQSAASMAATGNPLHPGSAAAANLAAGLQSAQTTTAAAAGQPAAKASPGTPMNATQLLPNAETASARMDSAFLSTGGNTNPWSGNTLGGSANSQGNLAKMLQSFSQSTVGGTTVPVNTSSGQGQIITPGQGAGLYASGAKNASAAPATTPGATTVGTAPSTSTTANSGQGVTNQAQHPVTSSGATNLASGTASNIVSNPAPATSAAVPQTAAGAATLRAEANAATGSSQAPTGTATSGGAVAPGTVVSPEVVTRPAQTPAAANSAAMTPGTTEAKAAAAGTQQAQTARTQVASPDAAMAAGVPTPLAPQDPAPKAGPLGLSNANTADPVLMSQAAAASGWGNRLQQSLNLNLGLPGLTPGALLSTIGLVIVALVMLRVFFNGIIAEEVVGLSFATIVGIGLMITPWVMKDRS